MKASSGCTSVQKTRRRRADQPGSGASWVTHGTGRKDSSDVPSHLPGLEPAPSPSRVPRTAVRPRLWSSLGSHCRLWESFVQTPRFEFEPSHEPFSSCYLTFQTLSSGFWTLRPKRTLKNRLRRLVLRGRETKQNRTQQPNKQTNKKKNPPITKPCLDLDLMPKAVPKDLGFAPIVQWRLRPTGGGS